MLPVVIPVLFAVAWAMIGAYTVFHPPITTISYVCPLIVLVAFYLARALVMFREHVRNKRH